MRLRPYISDRDFDHIKNWITDERTHAFWCAGRFEYPLNKENFDTYLQKIAVESEDYALVATTYDDVAVGFLCYGVNYETNEGMLKFVVVDPEQRGNGTAAQMLALIITYGLEITNVYSVHLNVFTENPRAKRCYEKAGFVERSTTPDAFTYKDEKWGRCNMIFRGDFASNKCS